MNNIVSPLFGEITSFPVNEIRVYYRQATQEHNAGVAISIRKIDTEDTKSVDSIEQAEDIVFAKDFSTTTIDMTDVGPDDTTYGDRCTELRILINRSSNIIAACTRRGAGNTLFVGANVMDIIRSANTNAYSSYQENDKVGRWFHVGKLNNTIEVYCSEAIDPNTAVVAYIGRTQADRPAQLIETDEGLRLYTMIPTKETLGDSGDYFRRIKLVTA